MAAPSAAPVSRVRPQPFANTNARLIGILALGHLAVDLNQGAFPAILPLLKSALHLSYGAAGTLVLVSNVTSSIVQPLFGFLSDRQSRRWMLPVALFCSGAGLSMIGSAGNYGSVMSLLVVMSLGAAAFHPEGFRTAMTVAGDRKATALSWFSLGGNIGYALGPPFITALVAYAGLRGTAGSMLPTLIIFCLLLAILPRLTSPRDRVHASTAPSGRNLPRAIVLLMVVVMIRSWTQLGFITYLPFYYVDYLKAPPRIVGLLLFVFLGAGALGTVVAGPLADRFGPRRFTVWAILSSAPLGASALLLHGVAGWIALAIFGMALVSTFSITVVLAQHYLPRNPGLASGLIVGFAIGAGGLGVAVLGWVADLCGLPVVLWISALLPLAGYAVATRLPAVRV